MAVRVKNLILAQNRTMDQKMIDRLKAMPFVNEQLKQQLIGHYQLAAFPAEERRQQAAFKHIIVAYTQIFPEDAATIRALFDWEIVSKAEAAKPHNKKRMVIRSDVFSASSEVLDMPRPCENCPGNIKQLVDQYPDDNEHAVEDFKLPAELYETDAPELPATELVEVVDRKSMEEFFGVGHRNGNDIIAEIRSYFANHNLAYNAKARSLNALLDEFMRLVVNPKL